jgi:hypothetical protein
MEQCAASHLQRRAATGRHDAATAIDRKQIVIDAVKINPK